MRLRLTKLTAIILKGQSLARRQYEIAFHLLSSQYRSWVPPVVTCSAVSLNGLENIYKIILDHKDKLTKSGESAAKA